MSQQKIDPIGENTLRCTCGCDLFYQLDIAMYRQRGSSGLHSPEPAIPNSSFFLKRCVACERTFPNTSIGVVNRKSLDIFNQVRALISKTSSPIRGEQEGSIVQDKKGSEQPPVNVVSLVDKAIAKQVRAFRDSIGNLNDKVASLSKRQDEIDEEGTEEQEGPDIATIIKEEVAKQVADAMTKLEKKPAKKKATKKKTTKKTKAAKGKGDSDGDDK